MSGLTPRVSTAFAAGVGNAEPRSPCIVIGALGAPIPGLTPGTIGPNGRQSIVDESSTTWTDAHVRRNRASEDQIHRRQVIPFMICLSANITSFLDRWSRQSQPAIDPFTETMRHSRVNASGSEVCCSDG